MPALIPTPSASKSKIHLTSGGLPSYLSPTQAPTKKSPWKTIRDVGFIRAATAILPEEVYQAIWQGVESSMTKVVYATVILKLEDLLQGDFFTDYVKRGNVLMLSEGEPGIDQLFSLKEGVLRLELSKESYERAGLQGTSVRSGGRKHVKSRYLVELNLRLPSMLHGKKGFERLVWAAKNVLNHSLSWIFLDLNQDMSENSANELKGPIMAHHPTVQPLLPTTVTMSDVLAPSILTNIPYHAAGPISSEETQETLYDVLEYLDMLSLASPRVQTTDQVDPFISRYEVPGLSERVDNGSTDKTGQAVRVVKWAGLIPIQWVLELLCAVIKQSRNPRRLAKEARWLALTVSAYKTEAVGQIDGYTVLLQPDPQANSEERTATVAHDDDAELPSTGDSTSATRGTQRTGNGQAAKDSEGDVEMSEAEAQRGQGSEKPVSTTLSRPGFQRFLCAEYVDCLT